MGRETVSPLGVCVFEEPSVNISYPHYLHEIFAHAGVCYETVTPEELQERLPYLPLLVTVGEARLSEECRTLLREWVRQGGGWLSIGGLCGLDDLLGVEAEVSAYGYWGQGTSTLGEGYLNPTQQNHPILGHLEFPLHFFNGVSVRAKGATGLASVLDAHQRPTSRQAVLEHEVECGLCLLIAPDVTGTVVRIQQGVAITRDGVPASDGTAPVHDGILKSDDGGALDWSFDRQPVPGLPGLNAFLHPIADLWRELVLRAVFHLADTLGVALPVLWFWPRNLPAVAHLSHDTDGNNPEKARRMLDVLKTAGINSTWCVILPGYDKELIAAIRDAGGELATHYDALEHPWSEAEFDRQWRELCTLFAPAVPVSNKNHYTRWEGDTEFFDWCAQRGIRLDQSKGVSKAGGAGFNFGACHPYFPLAPDGRRIDVLELPTPAQDLEVFVPEAFGAPLLEAVCRNHGVLHLLFHPGSIALPNVADALLRAVRQAQARGMEWWTARQLDAWERARRQVRWTGYRQESAEVRVTLNAGEQLPEATLLWLGPSPVPVSVNGMETPGESVTRWGFAFSAATFTLSDHTEIVLKLTERG